MKLKLVVTEYDRSVIETLFADVYEDIHFEIPDEFEYLAFEAKTMEELILNILEHGGYVYAINKHYPSTLITDNDKARLPKKPFITEDEYEDETVYYPIDWNSVKAGLENEEVIQEVINIAKGDADCRECYNIMQCIMFGEVYY